MEVRMPDFTEQFCGPVWMGYSPDHLAKVRTLEETHQIVPGTYRQVIAHRTVCHRALLALNFIRKRFAHDMRKQASGG
jgi:hypothetical protein